MTQENGQAGAGSGIVGSAKQAVCDGGDTAQGLGRDAHQGAKDAAHSDTFRKLARVGHVANGIHQFLRSRYDRMEA